MAAFGVDANVARLGGEYLRILLWFNVPMAVGLVLSSGLRGAGDVRTPLLIGVFMNLVNVVAHYVLVFGHFGAPRLETAGSAIATGLSFLLGALLYLGLWQRNALAVDRGPWLEGFTRERMGRILRIGLPTAVEQFAWQIGLFLFLRIVAGFGTEPVAAYMIGVRILSFSFVPGLGFSTAASTLVGQHLGAGEPELATRSGWRSTAAAVGVMASAGLAIAALAPTVAGWFGATGEDTVRLTIVFIYILGAAQPLMAVEYALGGALRGAGDTRFPLFAILTGLFCFRLAGSALVRFVFDGGVVAVWSVPTGRLLREGLAPRLALLVRPLATREGLERDVARCGRKRQHAVSAARARSVAPRPGDDLRGGVPRALDGKACSLPRCQAPLEMKHRRVAGSKKSGLALASAWPEHAVEGDAIRRVDLGDPLRHLVERDVQGARDVARGVLFGRTNVDDDRPAPGFAARLQLGGADARGFVGLRVLGESRDGQKRGEGDCRGNATHVTSPRGHPGQPLGPQPSTREDPRDEVQDVRFGDHPDELLAGDDGEAADPALRHDERGFAHGDVRTHHDRRVRHHAGDLDDVEEEAALVVAVAREIGERGAQQVAVGDDADEAPGQHDRDVPHLAERHDIFDGRERFAGRDGDDALLHHVADGDVGQRVHDGVMVDDGATRRGAEKGPKAGRRAPAPPGSGSAAEGRWPGRGQGRPGGRLPAGAPAPRPFARVLGLLHDRGGPPPRARGQRPPRVARVLCRPERPDPRRARGPGLPGVRAGARGHRPRRRAASAPRRSERRDQRPDPAPGRGRGAPAPRGLEVGTERVSGAALPGPGARRPVAGPVLTAAAVGLAVMVYRGLGPRPKARAWWEPNGNLARLIGETSLAPLVEETSLALWGFGLAAVALAAAVFAATRSALARWLAVSAVLATLCFVFYALEARFVWSFFRWRWSASLLLLALTVGAAVTAPLLAASWLRLGWRARIASYLPIFLAVLAFERNVTGTDQSLRFAISPWPFVQIFGLEVVAACLGALAFGVGLGLAAGARARRGGGAAFWVLGALCAAGLPAGAFALAAYRELLPFHAGAGAAGSLGAASLATFAFAATLGVGRRPEVLSRRALVSAVGGALVLAPIALGQTLARLDYAETRDGRAQRVIDALARHRAQADAYPDELAELVVAGELERVPSPRIGFPGFSGQEFVYQNFGESYLLEFSAPRWIQCAYNPPYVDEEDGAEADEDAEGDGLGDGAWSCPSKPPELW